MTSNLFQEGEKDTEKLKEHIRILQEENFTRIAQIADLQVEVNNLKVWNTDTAVWNINFLPWVYKMTYKYTN